MQYNLKTNKEYFKLNLYAESLWRIKAVYSMKRIYPLKITVSIEKKNIDLYKYGVSHYENLLKNNISY